MVVVYYLGDNFGVDVGLVSVLIDHEPCHSIAIIHNHTHLACIVGEGTGGPHSVTVTVDHQTTNADIFFYEGK